MISLGSTIRMYGLYCGWLRNPTPVDRWQTSHFFRVSNISYYIQFVHLHWWYFQVVNIQPKNHVLWLVPGVPYLKIATTRSSRRFFLSSFGPLGPCQLTISKIAWAMQDVLWFFFIQTTRKHQDKDKEVQLELEWLIVFEWFRYAPQPRMLGNILQVESWNSPLMLATYILWILSSNQT